MIYSTTAVGEFPGFSLLSAYEVRIDLAICPCELDSSETSCHLDHEYDSQQVANRDPSGSDPRPATCSLANKVNSYASKRNCRPSGARRGNTFLKRPNSPAWSKTILVALLAFSSGPRSLRISIAGTTWCTVMLGVALNDPFALNQYRDYLRILASQQLAGRFQGKADLSGIVQKTLWESALGSGARCQCFFGEATAVAAADYVQQFGRCGATDDC